MALLGKIEEFDPKKEDWRQYLERLEEFFVANDLTGESKAVKRRSTFISLIGPEPYKLLRSLLSPEKPKDKTFEALHSKTVGGCAEFPVLLQSKAAWRNCR